MGTIDSEYERLGFLRTKGRGQEKCHIVLIEEEARERIKNPGPKPKTKFVVETDDPEMYSKLNELKDRWFANANKSVALSMMARLLDQPDYKIKELCSDEA